MSDKRQQVIDLHNELRQTVGDCRFSHLIALKELQDFGGKDEYKASVSIIVDRSGAEGVLVTRLRDVLPDSVDLNAAIDALKKDGEIEEVGKGRSIRLVSKKKPASPTENPPSDASGDDNTPPALSSKVTPEKETSRK